MDALGLAGITQTYDFILGLVDNKTDSKNVKDLLNKYNKAKTVKQRAEITKELNIYLSKVRKELVEEIKSESKKLEKL